jgi:Eukaryotic protein of unknown function (DUF829)
MMPATFIDIIATVQKSRSERQVFQHNFVTSAHVMHLREQPAEYQKQIQSFLRVARIGKD